MTLQELLKNDEDKRSHHAAKSGKRPVGPAGGADSDSSASAADMFIKAGWQHSVFQSVCQSVSLYVSQTGGQISCIKPAYLPLSSFQKLISKF